MGMTNSALNPDDPEYVLHQLRQFFAVRLNTFDELVTVGQYIADDLGEQILDCFCLTEIDQWDREHERYVFICENCLISVDFDFRQLVIRRTRILWYAQFDKIRVGQLHYENFNFETHAGKLGIKFSWNNTQRISQFEEWNPFYSEQLPWTLLTSHPLKNCIDDAVACRLSDNYFSLDYLRAIRKKFAVEVFHDKLFYVLQSLHANARSLNTVPCLSLAADYDYETRTASSTSLGTYCGGASHHQHQQHPTLIQLERPSNPSMPTFVHYAPIIMPSIFNLPGFLYNRFRAGYNRFRFV